MPPTKSWAMKGRKGSARILGTTKHAGREWLPILLIIHGVPGGRSEENEFKEYPGEHFYSAQENAWMDKNVWKIYRKKDEGY
ncbi:hypothetical protein PF011_g15207 [Phytophthora fragariae]|uniref:DDE-1 domain-containing protein n=1 Tax=Phytophthora fragariae TaxID=53985 RepID=A0A6A3JT45_9STRA|nr:hypothetical protein PF011_g15207 [Phytophthora fragariae]